MLSYLRSAAFGACTVFASIAATSALAVSYVYDPDGLPAILGAEGVEVDGNVFNVDFVDTTCELASPPCVTGQFAFGTEAEARVAAQALLDQVTTSFYSQSPWLVNGCDDFSFPNARCYMNIPFQTTSDEGEITVSYMLALNNRQGLDSVVGPVGRDFNFDFGASITNTIAVFSVPPTQPAPIPLPAPALLLIGGLAGLGVMRRRKG